MYLNTYNTRIQNNIWNVTVVNRQLKRKSRIVFKIKLEKRNDHVKASASGTKLESISWPGTDTKSISQGVIRFGFPKGSLQQSTEDLFYRAGYRLKISERGYFPSIDDDMIKLVLFRSQEISRYVEDNILDAGICGQDWILENNSDVIEVCELSYSKATTSPARWVLAVDENSEVQKASDLEGCIISSELVNITRKFFEDKGINIRKVEFSWGATEVKAKIPGIGAIVDITETGSSIRANNLRIIDTIMSSTTRLIANKKAWENETKRRKIEDVAMLLTGAINGRLLVGLKMNIEKSNLEKVVNVLPASLSPTVSPLHETNYFAIDVIINENEARDIVTNCRRIGALDIVTYSIQNYIQN